MASFSLSRGFVAALLSFALLSHGQSSEVVLQNGLDGYTGASDATLRGQSEKQHRLNYGHAPTLEVAGVAKGGLKSLGVIRFSGLNERLKLSSNRKISRATLSLYKISEPKDEGQYGQLQENQPFINVFPLLTEWEAGTQNGAVEDGAVTFAYRRYESQLPVFWGDSNALESGPVSGIDYRSERPQIAGMLAGMTNVWLEWDVTAAVQQWISEPESNHGLLLTARGYWIGCTFASCEADAPDLRPKLTIEYQ